jgi:hypothetical protein
MTIIGRSDQWHGLLDSLVPDIVDLIVTAWDSMPPIAPDSREDPVSDELCKRLRAAKQLADLPLQIRPQIVELDSAAEDVKQGRIDIVFLPLVPDESIYFALECKRVNARKAGKKIRRYFSEYVTEGLMRFITGQYSHAVRHGGMIAFVLDGDVKSAMEGVVKNIVDKRKQVQLVSGEVGASRYVPSNEFARETTHSRSVSAGEVLIQHFFLPVKKIA